jgi:hypothetical protein
MSGSRLLERTRNLLGGRLDFALGLFDQGILSGCALLLTLVLAGTLDAPAFGRFSVAWAMSVLLEQVVFRGLLDDGLPAMAHRLPKSLWPQLRASLYGCSLALSGAMGTCVMIGGLVALSMSYDSGWLALATGLAIPANRLQTVFRRLCYLDGRLVRVAVSAAVYLCVLSGSTTAMIRAGMTSAAGAMVCIAVSAAAAGSVAFVAPRELAWARSKVIRWSIIRLFRSGRWFVATSLTYWISSTGLIPLCGALLGLSASGSLRIMLVAFAPLGQFNASLVSIKLPRTAAQLRLDRRAIASAARRNAWLFGGLAAIYGLFITLVGVRPLIGLARERGYEITFEGMLAMALAMSLESVWLGVALPLIAAGKPQRTMLSRLAGLLVLCSTLPLTVHEWGLLGVIVSMVLSSAASVAALLVIFPRSVHQ